MSRKTRFLVVASVHQGSEPLSKGQMLGREIDRIYKEHFGEDVFATCIWLELPPGQAYIAGQPSTASTLLTPVPDDTEQTSREAFMSAICDLFQDETGYSQNEIIVTAMNVSDALRYAEKSRRRFDPKRSKATMAKIAGRMLLAKPKLGYFKTSLTLPE